VPEHPHLFTVGETADSDPDIITRPARNPMARVLRNMEATMTEARWVNMADAVMDDLRFACGGEL